MDPQHLIKGGDLAGALESARNAVRSDPASAEKRVALFQIECVCGRWEKAHAQLEALSGLNAEGAMLAAIFGPVLVGEATREAVFAGKRSPIIFGEPDRWISLLVRACEASVDSPEASTWREEALAEAPASPGSLNDRPFEWLADADSRLGPLLEVIMEGGYRWVPFFRIASIEMEPPRDLRDLVWTAARFRWTNGGEATGFIPARYSGSGQTDDAGLALSRRTEWIEQPDGAFFGKGQRVLATDQEECALLEIRKIQFTPAVLPEEVNA